MVESTPIIRATNGDSSYFKRTPVEDWVTARDRDEGESVLCVSINNDHLHCAKAIYGRCPQLLYDQGRKCKFTPLHRAVYRDHIKPSMMKFIISVADRKLYRMTDDWENTPLQLAIDHNHLVAIKLLIEVDPDHLSYVDPNGQTPLSNAIRLSHLKPNDDIIVEIRRLLLEKQPNASKLRTRDRGLRTRERGWTVLHQATSTGDRGAIEDIIRFCPDSVYEVDNQGLDFLDTASASGHSEVVKSVLQMEEIWDSILKGGNTEGIKKLQVFKSDNGKKNLDNTLSEREKELCIPPKHLVLYRELVNQFGEIVQPSNCEEGDPTPTYVALGRFLGDVSEMVDVNPAAVCQEKISEWEKMGAQYAALGLQVSWFQKHIAKCSNWFTEKAKHLSPLEDEIATKEEALHIKYSELYSLRNELEELYNQRDTYIIGSDTFPVFPGIILE